MGAGVRMKPRINMITLGVQDLKRAIRFYEEGLGLPRKPFEGDVAFFELKGSWLAPGTLPRYAACNKNSTFTASNGKMIRPSSV